MNTLSKLIIKATIVLSLILTVAQTIQAQETQSDIAVAVAPTKMNILYIGVDNPVEIAVSGYKPQDIIVSISGEGSTITPTEKIGCYLARVTKQGEVTVTVSAKTKKGIKELAIRHFRVKRVPTPTAVVGTDNKGGEINKLGLINNVVIAKMENFDFDIKCTVVHFTVSTTVDGELKQMESNKNIFTSEQKTFISNLPLGSIIYIEDIISEDPDGYQRTLAPLKFTLK